MQRAVFLLRALTQVYRCLCVPQKHVQKAQSLEQQLQPTLKQLPQRTGAQHFNGSRYRGRTEAGVRRLKEWQCVLVLKEQQSQFLFCLAPERLLFFQGEGGVFSVGQQLNV